MKISELLKTVTMAIFVFFTFWFIVYGVIFFIKDNIIRKSVDSTIGTWSTYQEGSGKGIRPMINIDNGYRQPTFVGNRPLSYMPSVQSGDYMVIGDIPYGNIIEFNKAIIGNYSTLLKIPDSTNIEGVRITGCKNTVIGYRTLSKTQGNFKVTQIGNLESVEIEEK
jgi:hypothetical protein